MPRPLRFVRPDVVYLLTRRTRDGRFAFAPTVQLVAELAGVIAEAQRRWPQVELHQINFPSNHMHALLSVRGPHCANALAAWTAYVFGQSALVAQAVHGLTGEIWDSKRYHLSPILDDAALRTCVRYVLAQAVTAGLVARPRQWPGLNSCDALCRGAPIIGYRANAALRRAARRDGVPLARITPQRRVSLSPLPMHRGWPTHQRQAWYRAIERAVVEGAEPGRRYVAPARLREVSPHRTVELVERPAPRCHAAPGNHEARRAWRAARAAFVMAWRAALSAWVNGARACFPPGGWVPFGACHAPGYVQRE